MPKLSPNKARILLDLQKKAVRIYREGYSLREAADIFKIKYKKQVSHQWIYTAIKTLQTLDKSSEMRYHSK
jgi:hypothetical protein